MNPTYQQLKDDTLAWLRRSITTTQPNIGDQLDQIIRLGETIIYYGQKDTPMPALLVSELWEERSYAISADASSVALGSELLLLESVRTADHPDIQDKWGYVATPNEMHRMQQGALTPVSALWYAIHGNLLEVYPSATTAWSVDAGGYYRKDYLDIDETPHAAFRNYYSIWLEASIMAACVYLKLQADAEFHRNAVTSLITSANMTEHTRRESIYAQNLRRPPTSYPAMGVSTPG